ncbi:MAG: VWA domain-containing protein [Candidatus Parvarchaeota archaeon]|nr:VWA domain-containing protein [Candidatus Jingweiarchaeum tengchongense]MCW1298130.1 VWA domain-containing protein [Candidatus Jingweiarchaeum tengchongense]MCW1299929.1 VWA domain-containing protein [Candidatus Jingweiarchaeum tengchongense]MCW1305118.1 VWA domain-containing protein [Candidatus Jingweiarchaeum tengchongense]MCW1305551.1 VWA domain-containing protein [Candidatus Jingweiarchaeum tengchongense]
MKKGFVIPLDMTIAIIILLFTSTIFTFFQYGLETPGIIYELSYQRAEDTLTILQKTKIAYVTDDPVVTQYINQGMITEEDMNKTILDLIGTFWSEGKVDLAVNLSKSIFDSLLPPEVGYEIVIGNDTIYSRPGVLGSIFRVRTVVSGFKTGEAPLGCIASAYIEKIKGKRTASYYYFGGFTGQGNLTFYIYDIPSDAIIESIYLELSTVANATLYINGNFCQSLNKKYPNYTVENWTIFDQNCINNISKGVANLFTINFSSPVTSAYIGGGYIKITYDTAQMNVPLGNVMQYNFTGISGVINLYDSFYIPGNLTSMEMHLEFLSNYSTFFNIGNKTIFENNGSNTTQIIDFNDSYLSQILNYSEISLETIPLRFGMKAFNITIQQNADVILITDLSGSMDWRLDSENTGIARNCTDPLLNSSNTKRISLAKCLDKEFVDIILNTSGNRVGLVGFYSDNSPPYKGRTIIHDLSDNKTSLYNAIDSYFIQGGTCICCGINRAYNILSAQSNASRKKFIVVMSDGIPTHQCGSSGTDECQGIRDGSPANEGLWLGWGAGCYGGGDDCNTTDCLCAMQNANWSSCRSYNNLNATVYSIGFGPVASCWSANWTLRSIADCGHGSYYASSDADELKQIYRSIAESILNASYTTQLIEVTNVTNTILYPSSYIKFNYTPIVPQYGYSEISIKGDTKPFSGCNGSFFVPGQLQIDDVQVTSYSFDYWTDKIFVNNSITNGSLINVFNLSKFGSDYKKLGDPYAIKFPAYFIGSNETNYINILLALSPTNQSTNCSAGDRVIYTGRIRTPIIYSNVLPFCKGSNVSVCFDKDHDGYADGCSYIAIGKNLPNFNATPKTVEDLNPNENAVDQVFLQLLDALNFVTIPANTGRSGNFTNPIDIELVSELNFDTVDTANVPSLWQPVSIEVRIS